MTHSRCFFLQTAQDPAPTPCKWKAGTKKHGPQVAFQDTFVDVRLSGVVALEEWSVELYQTRDLSADTDISAVFNIPLVSDILVYPVILRVVSQTELPSLGRVKKGLCDYLIENADHTFFPEEEEDLPDDKSDLPSLTDDERTEILDDDDDASIPSDTDIEELDDIVDLDQDEDEEEEDDVLDDDE